jgi:NitT/TauT family transport system substrate-binding protein
MRAMSAARIVVCVLALAALPARAEDKVWRHGLLEAKADAGFMMMIGHGFAEKRGLKVELVQFKNDVAPLQALLAGELDSFEGGPQGVIIAAGRGADLKVIGCHYPGMPHGIFVRDTVQKPADLRGKTIAISAPGAFPDILAHAILAKYDIPAADVSFANLGGDGDRFKALAAKVVDAAVISSEYTPIAEKQGVRMLVAGRDVLPDYLRTCIMSSGKVLAARHDDAVHFMAAEISAIRFALGHRDDTIKLTQEMTGAKPDDPRAAFLYDDALRTHAVDPDVGLPVDKLLWLQQLLVKQGDLPAPYDIHKVVDASVREAAIALVGK